MVPSQFRKWISDFACVSKKPDFGFRILLVLAKNRILDFLLVIGVLAKWISKWISKWIGF